MQGLAEEPRTRGGREGRERLGARIADALAPVDVGDRRGVGHEREADPRQRPARGLQTADVPDHRLLAGARGPAPRVADADALADRRQQDVRGEGHRDAEALVGEVDRLALHPGRLGFDLEAKALAEIDAAALQRA